MATVNININAAEVPVGKNITVSNMSSYIEQCGAGNDSTVLTTSILLSDSVSVDTIFSIETKYSLTGDCGNFVTANTSITILAGDISGDSPGCSNGAQLIEYYASICATSLWQHDNTLDTISV